MIKNFLKGLLIGCAKVIPGVSGSVVAISLNVYFKSLEIINKFYCVNKSELKIFLPIFFGVLIGILLFSAVINSVYQKFYLFIILLFTGFIIGETYKSVIVNVKKDIFCYIFAILFILILPFFDIKHIDCNNKNFLYPLLGMVEAVTMIIPGISGTAILMSLDLYDVYLKFIISLSNINFLISNIKNILLYSISLVVAGYFTIKIIFKMYNKYSFLSSIIRSLTLITIIVMLKKAIFDINFNMLYILILILGFVLANLFNKLINKNI